MKKKKRWISKVAVSLGLLTMLGGVALSAGSAAYAVDQDISNNPVSDDTSDRKITLWKYEINSSAELGERGDGINPDPSKAPNVAGKKMMQDVNFEIIKIKPIGSAELTDPLKQVEGTDWEVDTTNAFSDKGATDSDGKLVFDVSKSLAATDKKLADGIYIVREIPDASGNYTYTKPADPTAVPPTVAEPGIKVTKPMDPFFVYIPQTKRDDTGSLIYDVHVYPKNIVTNTKLDKTVEGGKGYSIKAGNSFQWEATTELPDGLYAIAPRDMTVTDYVDLDDATSTPTDTFFAAGDEIYASYFKVSDEISEDLQLIDAEVYAIDKTGTPVKLTNGTHYVVTLDGTTITPPNKVEDLTEGAKKKVVVSLTKAGMKEIGTNEHPKLQVVYKVNTNKDFNGMISNKYTIDYLLPGGTPDTGTSDEPEYYNGGFDIKKVKTDGTTTLDGAEFHIAENEENAEKGIFLASDGKSYKKDTDKFGAADTLPSGVTFLKATAGEDPTKPGIAEFDGLKLDWFTDNTAGPNANDGKQDPSDPTEATWSHDKIQKDYWVVETKAPTGYELLKDPKKVTVKLGTPTTVPPVPGTEDDGEIELTVINNPKTDLPFTGGTGTMLLVAIALGAITIGTVAIAIDKKRRAA
ncbi:SpaH/EbpB family LPXTG-anchored major pilin [Candidatus Enterococcus ferrettii]|uniref:Gram-positive pilin subunit D1 N-terminal domain-containing protein n=1 Tax=Candidatus Enterococcus ferrettii TaxID=2815324 RepID=A0ABV0EN15_9ENTE|nr:SpaH/EbpB family LPXTG-anchored major pilin [Enterococcus sp. 665A]MBO1340016.1 SpaH/EbpB family LPXTG-anchored major pilin [Enterococcus sp. 665A]